MTTQDLLETIAQSANSDWYHSFQVPLSFPVGQLANTFTGVPSLYDFVLNQETGFKGLGKLPPELEYCRNLFIQVKKNIVRLVTTNNQDKQVWIDNLNPLVHNNTQIFLFDFPETEFLINLFNANPKAYPGAYRYLIGNLETLQRKPDLIGTLLAYEFTSKPVSVLADRKELQQKSIEILRNDFQGSVDKFQEKISSYLEDTQQNFTAHASQIDNLTAEKQKEFKTWFDTTSTTFKTFNEGCAKKISDLESLYQEKLKLEAPATYWLKRAGKLRKEGYGWLIGLLISVALTVSILLIVLFKISDGELREVFKDTATAVKWSVIFVTIISFMAYIIRTFSKLTFSSFHLVRDAEEREQLAYVYLALKKEEAIDETERHLVMQSLFSRADSGLLKDEGSPTMPGNIIDQVVKK